MPLLGYVVVTLLATYAFCKIMKLEGWWKPDFPFRRHRFVYLSFVRLLAVHRFAERVLGLRGEEWQASISS